MRRSRFGRVRWSRFGRVNSGLMSKRRRDLGGRVRRRLLSVLLLIVIVIVIDPLTVSSRGHEDSRDYGTRRTELTDYDYDYD